MLFPRVASEVPKSHARQRSRESPQQAVPQTRLPFCHPVKLQLPFKARDGVCLI